MNLHIQQASFNSQYGEEYAITLEFELQREKQKNKILEQRLRNKEMFIVEMKKMQSQMQLLSQKWRQQLLQEREKREVLENITLREYAETIADLQHKINLIQVNQPQKKLKGQEKIQRNRSTSRLKRQSQEVKVKENFSRQKQQVNELLKNFATRFLEMYSIYNRGSTQQGLKRSLKAGWKWIKNIVKKYEQDKKSLKQIYQYAERCRENDQQCDPVVILNNETNSESDNNDQENA